MQFIKGFTFGWGYRRNDWNEASCYASLDALIERTASDTIILPVLGLQEHTYATHVYKSSKEHEQIPTKEEVERVIGYCHEKGLRVILKCVVNCLDGYWRAYINFFSKDVVCEPTWQDWFESYGAYVAYVADIAQKNQVEMLMVGCEMVCSDGQSSAWRALIAQTRNIYHGLITYNCDKYQEDNIDWWDACDVISSSGYYPVGTWDTQLRRIQKVVDTFDRPFFFAEAGCPSRDGSEYLPNDWSHDGAWSEEAQSAYYKEMFTACEAFDFVQGFGLWDWKSHLYPRSAYHLDCDYAVYGKQAETIIQQYYATKQ